MTRNQIEYNKLLETQRANKANETLTDLRDRAAREARVVELRELGRHNLATEQETVRHNVAGEEVASRQASELERHQRQTESLQHAINLETNRANLAREQQARDTLAESRRHSLVTEQQGYQTIDLRGQELAESIRHSKAQESISRTQAAASQMQAAAVREQARIAASKALIAQQEANTRSRQISQDYQYKMIDLGLQGERLSQTETSLTQRDRELNQQMWRNQAQINLDRQKLDEEVRHNKMSEINQAVSSASRFASSIPGIISLW